MRDTLWLQQGRTLLQQIGPDLSEQRLRGLAAAGVFHRVDFSSGTVRIQPTVAPMSLVRRDEGPWEVYAASDLIGTVTLSEGGA